MKKSIRILGTLALFVCLLGLAAEAAPAQNQVYEEIAGDYILDANGRELPFTVFYKDGKLTFDAGIPDRESQPMTPVAGKDLTFMSIDPNGDEMIMVFSRNDQKKIAGCKVSLPSRGIETDARKVEKQID